MYARRSALALPHQGANGKGLRERPRELRPKAWPALAPVPDTSTAIHRPHLGLLRTRGTVNGESAKILFDDGALKNFVSSAFVKRQGIATETSTEAALMPDGNTYNLASTKYPLEICINDRNDELHFTVCTLASINVILGKKWHEDVCKKIRTISPFARTVAP